MIKTFSPHIIPAHMKGITWLILLSFLSMTLFSNHYHLHHDADSTHVEQKAHDHEMDFHFVSDEIDVDHHQDDHTVDLSSDITFKPTNIQIPLFVLIVTLVLLLPLFSGLVRQSFPYRNNKFLKQLRFNTPPLRAPPLS